MPTPLTWANPEQARTDYKVTATQAQLDTAREECLRAVGLALNTPTPPSVSFREGVVLQALANQYVTQGDAQDETGMINQGVRLYPLGKAIRSKLIVPSPDADDDTRDDGLVRSLIG